MKDIFNIAKILPNMQYYLEVWDILTNYKGLFNLRGCSQAMHVILSGNLHHTQVSRFSLDSAVVTSSRQARETLSWVSADKPVLIGLTDWLTDTAPSVC